MREILFHGKRVDNGEWVEGFYVHLLDGKGRESHRIYTGYAETDCGDFYPDWYEVDPDTVGQYTGVEAHGKKIFEGDIVEYEGRRYCVKYYPPFAMYMFYRKNCGTNGMITPLHECVVIGNIHDNPELLNKEG